MGKVMISCPVNGKPVFTGMRIDETAFAAVTMPKITLGSCSQCGRTHKWSKVDAWVEVEVAAPAAQPADEAPRLTVIGGGASR